MNLGKETGGMGKRWRENRFESVPKENKEGCAEKGDRLKVENTVSKGEFTERNVKANRYLLLEVGQKKECGEQTSCQGRSQTPAFSSWLSSHSPQTISTSYLTTLLRAHLHLHTQIPEWDSPQSPVIEKSLQ